MIKLNSIRHPLRLALFSGILLMVCCKNQKPKDLIGNKLKIINSLPFLIVFLQWSIKQKLKRK